MFSFRRVFCCNISKVYNKSNIRQEALDEGLCIGCMSYSEQLVLQYASENYHMAYTMKESDQYWSVYEMVEEIGEVQPASAMSKYVSGKVLRDSNVSLCSFLFFLESRSYSSDLIILKKGYSMFTYEPISNCNLVMEKIVKTRFVLPCRQSRCWHDHGKQYGPAGGYSS